jgi:hypothetical protein
MSWLLANSSLMVTFRNVEGQLSHVRQNGPRKLSCFAIQCGHRSCSCPRISIACKDLDVPPHEHEDSLMLDQAAPGLLV